MNEDPNLHDEEEEPAPELSSDPEEALRLENELTRLRLQAEFGAQFGGDLSGLPPEVEQKFLENIMRMEAAMNQSEGVTVSNILGNPDLKPVADLCADELEAAWADINSKLEAKNIRISFDRKTALEERYRFVMEDVMPLPFFAGMPDEAVFHVPYEEFYPNHKAIMERLAMALLEAVFRHRIVMNEDAEQDTAHAEGDYSGTGEEDENSDDDGLTQDDEEGYHEDEPHNYGDMPDGPPGFQGLTSGLILADGRQIPDEALEGLTDDFHAQFSSIEGFRYNVTEVSHTEPGQGENPMPGSTQRLGHVEGMVSYDVVHHDGERQTIEGPYKLYMQAEGGWWQVFYFVVPGWVW